MSLYFSEFGGLPEGKSFISNEKIPSPWDKMTPVQGDILQVSLDALLKNDVMQESSTAHITLNRESLEHSFSGVDIDLTNDYAEFRGHSNFDTLDYDKSYIGTALPIPDTQAGVTSVVSSKSDTDGASYITWSSGRNAAAMLIKDTKTKTFTSLQDTSGWFCDLAIIPTSALSRNNGDVECVQVKINGEIRPVGSAHIYSSDGGKTLTTQLPNFIGKTNHTWQIMSLINAKNDVCVYNVEKNSDGTYTRTNITPIQKFSWLTPGLDRRVARYWAFEASNNNVLSVSTSAPTVSFWPLNIKSAFDSSFITGTYFGIGLNTTFGARKSDGIKWEENSSVPANTFTVKLYKDVLCEVFYK